MQKGKPTAAQGKGEISLSVRSNEHSNNQVTINGDSQTSSKNAQIRKLLYLMAEERAKSLRWNLNTLIISYTILIAVVVLTFNDVSSIAVGLVAIFGLTVLWLYGWLRGKRLEQQFYQQEIRQHTELISDDVRPITPTFSKPMNSPLTDREMEILKLVIEGKTNKEIGLILGVKEATIKNHLVNVYEKLNVRDRTSAAVTAIRDGWITLA